MHWLPRRSTRLELRRRAFRRAAHVLAVSILSLSVTACLSATTPALLPVDEADVRALFRIQLADLPGGFAGHAFLVLGPAGERLALTAFHVAGPVLSGPVSPGASPVVTAWLQTVVNSATRLRLRERVPIAGARTIGNAGSQDDLAAYRPIDWDSTRALRLGDDLPRVGDTVFVLAVHVGDSPWSGPRRHPARVAVSHDSAFVYVYLASANSNGTSGAAVLDRRGNVVGVNVGSVVTTPDTWERYRERYAPCCDGARAGDVIGLAVGIRSIRAHLAPLPR
jgi:hypothetical protein